MREKMRGALESLQRVPGQVLENFFINGVIYREERKLPLFCNFASFPIKKREREISNFLCRNEMFS